MASMTLRACAPEPPLESLIASFSPVFACQYFAKLALKSAYSSRVGSYETLSRVVCAKEDNGRAAAKAATTNKDRVRISNLQTSMASDQCAFRRRLGEARGNAPARSRQSE